MPNSNGEQQRRRGPSWRLLLWIIGAALVGLIILSVGKELGIGGEFGVDVGVVKFQLSAKAEATLSVSERPNESPQTISQSDVQAIPIGNACYIPGGFVMPWPEWWYPGGNGWWIKYHAYGGFEVSDPSYLGYWYPDPGGQWPRNQWVPLQGTPLQVCVDYGNYVYALYSG